MIDIVFMKLFFPLRVFYYVMDVSAGPNRMGLCITLSLVFLAAVSHPLFSQNSTREISPRQLIRNIKNKTFRGHTIDVDISGEDLKGIFKKLEDISGIPFVVDTDIDLRMKKYLFKSIPWDKAVDLILSDTGLELRLQKDIVRVTKPVPVKSRMSMAFLTGMISTALFILISSFTALKLRKKSKVRKQARRLALGEDKVEEVKKSLAYFMEVEKIYRDESLTLNKLAERVSITPHQLSRVINVKLGKSFSDVVNHYRIEEIKKRLVSPDDRDHSILEIAFETGFNTKSTFNKTFKVFTGKTPRDFRKKFRTAS